MELPTENSYGKQSKEHKIGKLFGKICFFNSESMERGSFITYKLAIYPA